MSIVTEFKSIKRILERQEQKSEFERNSPMALASFWETYAGKPAGSFRGEYMGVPFFEID